MARTSNAPGGPSGRTLKTGAEIPVNAIDEVEPAGAGLHTHQPVHLDAHALIAESLTKAAGDCKGMTPGPYPWPAGKPYDKNA